MAIGNLDLGWKPLENPLFVFLALFCCFLGGDKVAVAGITADDSLGSESTFVIENGTINNEIVDYLIQGGARRDDKLFHSFLELNVLTGEKVSFDPPTGVNHIYGRVTGGNSSFINGVVEVAIPANLSLFNPHGFHLGQEASFALPQSSLLLSTGRGFLAIEPLQGNILEVVLAPREISTHGSIVSQAHLSVEGNLNLEAAFLDVQGSLTAGGSIHLIGFDIFLRDDVNNPTTIQTGEGFFVSGDRVSILLHKHPDSGIFANGTIALFGRENIVVKGWVETNENGNLNHLIAKISVESEDSIQLHKAILNVFGESGSIRLTARTLEIFASTVSAEIVETDAETFRIEESEIFSRGSSLGEGEIDILAKTADFDRTKLILEDLLTGSIKITGDRLIFQDSEVLNRSLQSHTAPKLILRSDILIAKNSQFATRAQNEDGISDIQFEVRDRIILEETNIFAEGNIDITTQEFFSSPDSLIESASGEVKVESLPTPILPPVKEILASPVSPSFRPILDNTPIGETAPLLDVDFEPESQLDDPTLVEAPMTNRCAAEVDDGLFEVRSQRATLPLPFHGDISAPDPDSIAHLEIPSNNPQEAEGSYPLVGGGIFLGSRCSSTASHSRRFFS